MMESSRNWSIQPYQNMIYIQNFFLSLKLSARIFKICNKIGWEWHDFEILYLQGCDKQTIKLFIPKIDLVSLVNPIFFSMSIGDGTKESRYRFGKFRYGFLTVRLRNKKKFLLQLLNLSTHFNPWFLRQENILRCFQNLCPHHVRMVWKVQLLDLLSFLSVKNYLVLLIKNYKKSTAKIFIMYSILWSRMR